MHQKGNEGVLRDILEKKYRVLCEKAGKSLEKEGFEEVVYVK